MTNTVMLRDKLKKSGYKMKYVAAQLGVTYQGFLNKINNESEFKAGEIQTLYDLLGLTKDERENIFFADDVGK